MLLYKYTRAKHLTSIVHGNLAFPRHWQLNDPFESSIESAIDHLRIDFKYDLPQSNVVAIIPGLVRPLSLPSEKRERFPQNLVIEDHNKRLGDTFGYLLLCRDHLGILSLTSNPESVRMWAHYAENSAGVCIGIEFDDAFFKEYKPASREHAGHSSLFEPKRVTYQPLRPTYGEPVQWYVEKAFFTKYEVWSYEQEYRLLRPIDECEESPNVHLYGIPTTLIKEVILGMKASDQVREVALDLSKQFKHLTFTKIGPISEKRYELKRRPLD